MNENAEYQKPLPTADSETRPYWEAARRHELRLPRCAECGTFRWPPRPGCPTCTSCRVEWPEVDRSGFVYTYTIVRRGVLPGFLDSGPYAVVVVEMPGAGGVRLIADLVDAPPDEVHIGMPVEVFFDDITKDVTLPRFRRAYGAER